MKINVLKFRWKMLKKKDYTERKIEEMVKKTTESNE